jgi:hypothetical protein
LVRRAHERLGEAVVQLRHTRHRCRPALEVLAVGIDDHHPQHGLAHVHDAEQAQELVAPLLRANQAGEPFLSEDGLGEHLQRVADRRLGDGEVCERRARPVQHAVPPELLLGGEHGRQLHAVHANHPTHVDIAAQELALLELALLFARVARALERHVAQLHAVSLGQAEAWQARVVLLVNRLEAPAVRDVGIGDPPDAGRIDRLAGVSSIVDPQNQRGAAVEPGPLVRLVQFLDDAQALEFFVKLVIVANPEALARRIVRQGVHDTRGVVVRAVQLLEPFLVFERLEANLVVPRAVLLGAEAAEQIVERVEVLTCVHLNPPANVRG